MSASTPRAHASPWRSLFEQVRDAVGTRRDEHGMLGSINWLRRQMEARGANPNVVRNIIYRDKGKLSDKRVLFEILSELWVSTGREPLQAPEIEVVLSPGGSAEQEVLQLLGREKRRAFRTFVRKVREGERPKLLVTGRPGSGKTMLSDYLQEALQVPPAPDVHVVRTEFGGGDLGASLVGLGEALHVPRATMEGRLAKVGTAGAFAVQADAQADVARAILEAARALERPPVLLLHVSQALQAQEDLGGATLRLNTPDVPRASAPAWLWTTLLEPLSHEPSVCVLVSMTDLPGRALRQPGGFEGPIKLAPPTTGEARRFVKARLPHLPTGQQEEIVQRAGRSFEQLRTMTLLAEIRAPLPHGDEGTAASVARLGDMVTGGGDDRIRDFLAALATVSLPEFPTFELGTLRAALPPDHRDLTPLELAFIDKAPGNDDAYRCFSRQLVRALRDRLATRAPERCRALHAAVAESLREAATADAGGEAAARRVHHLFEARQWEALLAWMRRYGVSQTLVRRAWSAACEELAGRDVDTFEQVAEQVASHYVALGSYRHGDARAAFEALARSERPRPRAWARLKEAEGAVLHGQYEHAEAALADRPALDDPLLEAEASLVTASIARWRGDLAAAANIVERDARPRLHALGDRGAAERLAHAKAAVWAGLIHKDRGDLVAAYREFRSVEPEDELVQARLSFQSGEVLMALGRLHEAGEAFDRAVRSAERSGALESERTRYLARRATLLRRRGRLDAAGEDLGAARMILDDTDEDEVEVGFWRARVDDEHAMVLLAHGRHDAAIAASLGAIERYRTYGDAHGVDAAFRIDRAVLRLATAYAARALGTAWVPPFPQPCRAAAPGRDAATARRLLARVAARTPLHLADLDPPDVLVRRAHLATSMLDAPEGALDAIARAAARSTHAYQHAEDRAHAASAHLRAGDPQAARAALNEAWAYLAQVDAHGADPGLRAWLHALGLRAATHADDRTAAFDALAQLLDDDLPDAMRRAALRAFGDALEGHGRDDWLTHPAMPGAVRGAPEHDLLRLGDLLATRWRGGAAVPRATQPVRGT
ncbi:MAG: hypothetical protein U5K81_10840 [Trueperaceae bacterium]|nr:hypothetical protein [Trueperaceae bacterium]